MQNNRKKRNDMDTQTKIKQERIINRCYVVWNHKRRWGEKEQIMIIMFKHPNNKVPFHKQEPTEILTEKQMKEKYGVNMRWKQEEKKN